MPQIDVSSLATLISLFITGLTVWLSFRERRASHRGQLYDKQLEGYQEVITALNTFYNSYLDAVVGDDVEADKNSHLRFLRENKDSFFRLDEAFRRWAIFLPMNFQYAFNNVYYVMFAFADPELIEKMHPGERSYPNNARQAMSDAYEKTVNTARLNIGVEPLTDDLFQIIGGPKSLKKATK